MNVFKILMCDIKEGIFKNKRFIIVPVLAFFECMASHVQLTSVKEGFKAAGDMTLFNLISQIFHGCDPISKIRESHMGLPYMWLYIFIFALFTTFDYAYNNITTHGVQVVLRTTKRSKWWYSKCIWSIISSIYFYVLFMLTVIIFAMLNGYSFSFKDNVIFTDIIANSSLCYTFKNISETAGMELILSLISPLIVICTLNICQMLFCLYVKPIYGFFISLGIILLSVFYDSFYIFPRAAMLLMNKNYFKEGYNLHTGIIVCIIIIAAAIIIGKIRYKKYDILPERNEV